MESKGRPKRVDKDTLEKLEEAFRQGLSDREACLYADLAPSTFYDFCKRDQRFAERRELLKESIKMRAKINLAKKIEGGDVDLSKWYLERKARNEFSTKQETESDGLIEVLFEIPRPQG